jgi:heptosyltransferase-3
VSPENEREQYVAEQYLSMIEPLGLGITERQPKITVSDWRKSRAHEIFSSEHVPNDKPMLAIHPFSLWKYKEWEDAQWICLIDHMNAKYNASVILTGAPEDRDRAGAIISACKSYAYNLAGKTSVGDLAGVLGTCSFFIGVDTAALHMAAAVGTPTVGIFGPTAPESWAPRGKKHTVITSPLSCQPCRDKGCDNSGTSRCLTTLSFEDIKDQLSSHLMHHGLSTNP